MIWGLIGVGVIALFLPAKPLFRFTVMTGATLVVLALFPTTGGRGAFGWTATTMVLLFVAVLGLVRLRRENFPLVFLPLLGFVAIGLAGIWGSFAGITSGSLNIVLAVAAWTAGLTIGVMHRDTPGAQRALVWLIALIVFFELIVTVLQLAGIPLFPPGERTLDLEGGRANGTFSHPSTPGKVLTLTMVLLLPATRAVEPQIRRVAYLAIVASIVPIAASLSRTNIVAAVAIVLVWSLIQPREKFFARRFALPAAVGIGLLFFINEIIARFQADPSGGEREHFMDVALQQLARDPWFGVGPAGYIEAVGKFDLLTSQGWPVHNIFVLQAVELGIVGAVLFFGPLVAVIVIALRHIRSRSIGGDYARAVVAYAPAFALIGWTGWGLLAPGLAALLMFVFAFALIQIRSIRAAEVMPLSSTSVLQGAKS